LRPDDYSDTLVTSTMSQVYQTPVEQGKWLLLIHRLPPKPDYLRVKVKRRLDRIGALAIKNSVYVLPDRSETNEDFEWLAVEIQKDGGEVLVCRSEFLAGISDEDIVERFNSERNDAYRSIRESVAADVRESELGPESSRPGWRETMLNSYAAAQRRLDEAARLDFFGADGRSEAEEELRRLYDLLQRTQPAKPDTEGEPHSPGATWVTRAGVFVDRMASAWLIRRFIDRDATFKFVSAARYQAAPGEVRFDMMPAEYTHVGDSCTFEVLLDRFELRDAGLVAIAEVVHDIDLKDDKFARSEAPGIEAVLTGIVNSTGDDDARLSAAFPLFDALYDRFRGSTG
jgi:hypothetical protein